MAYSFGSACAASQVSSTQPSFDFNGTSSGYFGGGASFATDNIPKCFAGHGSQCWQQGSTIIERRTATTLVTTTVKSTTQKTAKPTTWTTYITNAVPTFIDLVERSILIRDPPRIRGPVRPLPANGPAKVVEGFAIPEPTQEKPKEPELSKFNFKNNPKVFEIKGGNGWKMPEPPKPTPKVFEIKGGPGWKMPGPPKPPPKVMTIKGGPNWSMPPLPESTKKVQILGQRPSGGDLWDGWETMERFVKHMKEYWEQGYRAEPVIG